MDDSFYTPWDDRLDAAERMDFTLYGIEPLFDLLHAFHVMMVHQIAVRILVAWTARRNPREEGDGATWHGLGIHFFGLTPQSSLFYLRPALADIRTAGPAPRHYISVLQTVFLCVFVCLKACVQLD